MVQWLAALVEASIYAGLAAAGSLFVASLLVRDGPAWTAWRWNVGSTVAALMGALCLVRGGIITLTNEPLMIIGAVLLIVGRLVNAVTGIILTIHLRGKA